MKRALATAGAVLVALGVVSLPNSAPSVAARGLPNDDATIAHVLNRMAFGARPGDVERVRGMGLQRYIDEQLRPERISDSAMDARLASLATLRLSSMQIAEAYELPLEEAQKARKEEKANGEGPDPELKSMQQRANQVVTDLAQAKVLRAAYSDRQLEEVLTDFWFNHFNVDARKGPDRFMLTEYERDVIRPHVLGHFRDLLEADAKSPAMLFYLDNWMSTDPNGPHPIVTRPHIVRGPFGQPYLVPGQIRPGAQGKNAQKGLNENYARELMELHTLGVDGGYTQHDVTEVARAFTGWSIDRPRQGGGFKFEPRLHDMGEKMVLGHRIKAGGGESDGEKVLDILASHPSTAHFISKELVERFVSDTPPPALVERAAKRFRETNGDLREVMRTILTSPEFLDVGQEKMKTPLEFVVSAVRATNADVQDALPLVRTLQQLGMPLYQCQPPTGYKDTADAWINTGALVSRMNFALQLANNQLRGITVAPAPGVESRQLALNIGGPEFQKR